MKHPFTRTATVLAATFLCCLPAFTAEIFISEYVEGSAVGRSDLDDAIELFNPLGYPIDLGLNGFFLDVCLDGQLPPQCNRIWIEGGLMIPAGGTFVITNYSADPALQALAQQQDDFLSFDGNDAVLLGYTPMKGERQIDFYVDAIGQAGVVPPLGCWCYPPASCTCDDPLSTLDAVLRRSDLFTGNDIPIDPTAGFTFDPTLWFGFEAGSWAGLGQGGEVPVELESFRVD
jgi:hypothetical protein